MRTCRDSITATGSPPSHGRAVWLHLSLLEQGELFAQEEGLGSECAPRPENEHEEVDEIARDGGQRPEAMR